MTLLGLSFLDEFEYIRRRSGSSLSFWTAALQTKCQELAQTTFFAKRLTGE